MLGRVQAWQHDLLKYAADLWALVLAQQGPRAVQVRGGGDVVGGGVGGGLCDGVGVGGGGLGLGGGVSGNGGVELTF